MNKVQKLLQEWKNTKIYGDGDFYAGKEQAFTGCIEELEEALAECVTFELTAAERATVDRWRGYDDHYPFTLVPIIDRACAALAPASAKPPHSDLSPEGRVVMQRYESGYYEKHPHMMSRDLHIVICELQRFLRE